MSISLSAHVLFPTFRKPDARKRCQVCHVHFGDGSNKERCKIDESLCHLAMAHKNMVLDKAMNVCVKCYSKHKLSCLFWRASLNCCFKFFLKYVSKRRIRCWSKLYRTTRFCDKHGPHKKVEKKEQLHSKKINF